MPGSHDQVEDRVERGVWGRIIANMSHELANAIGILGQATGLLGDLLGASGPGRPIDPARLRVILERLERQTSRASELLEHLSYFAHSVDDRCAEVELNSLSRNLVAISARLASMRGVDLELNCAADEVRLSGDAYGLLQVLFLVLEGFYQNLDSGSEIEITVLSGPAGVQISSASVISGEDERFAAARSLATRMGGTVTLECGADGTVFSFIPAAESG
jgi:hypothetical protein